MKILLTCLCLIAVTCEAVSVKPESIVSDINDFVIVKAFPCNPPNRKTTCMCLIIEKDGRQLMSIHDINTKRPLEIRDGTKIIWSADWEVV